jgi:hypothetical protein
MIESEEGIRKGTGGQLQSPFFREETIPEARIDPSL